MIKKCSIATLSRTCIKCVVDFGIKGSRSRFFVVRNHEKCVSQNVNKILLSYVLLILGLQHINIANIVEFTLHRVDFYFLPFRVAHL